MDLLKGLAPPPTNLWEGGREGGRRREGGGREGNIVIVKHVFTMARTSEVLYMKLYIITSE